MNEIEKKIKEVYQRKGEILNKIKNLKLTIDEKKEEQIDYLEDEITLNELREEIKTINQKAEVLEEALMIVVGLRQI